MASLRKAVNAKCKDCIYDPSSRGTWKQQVTLCSCKTCALWPHRPKTASSLPKTLAEYYGLTSEEIVALDAQIASTTSKRKAS